MVGLSAEDFVYRDNLLMLIMLFQDFRRPLMCKCVFMRRHAQCRSSVVRIAERVIDVIPMPQA
jgi:hypothetical protein